MAPDRKPRGTKFLLALFCLLIADAFSATSARSEVVVDAKKKEVRFRAKTKPSAMSRPFGVQGHHAVVWREGDSASWALFAAEASDQEVRAALRQLGAKSGENLTIETWTQRDDAKSREPDKRVDGSRIEVLVEWKGSDGRVPLHDLISAPNGDHRHFDFRFGGNARFQKEFDSGCIVCLYSCPGGAIGNRNKTIRDYVNEGVIFESNRHALPKGGTMVTIILRLL